MHAEFVPMSQRRHLAIIACVDSLCAIRTQQLVHVFEKMRHFQDSDPPEAAGHTSA